MDGLVEKYFNAESENISFTDFQKLAEFGETNSIERKSIRQFDDIDKNKEQIKGMLSKEVSAFANYSGGIILLGVDDKTGEIEEGVENKYGNSTIREWLPDIITSCTTPAINEFCVRQLEHNSKHLFVIIVKESRSAPHQASHGISRHRYYTRIDNKTQAIDGILVRDIFYRRGQADLNVEFSIINKTTRSGANDWRMKLEVKNPSSLPAEKVLILLDFTETIFKEDSKVPDNHFNTDIARFKIDIVYPGVVHFVPSRYMQIYRFTGYCNLIIVAKNMPHKKMRFNFIGDKAVLMKNQQ